MKTSTKIQIISIIILVITASAGILTCQAPNRSESSERKLIWSDEFDGPAVDTSKWDFDTGNGFYSGSSWISGWGNEELEYYTKDNAAIEDGYLIITAENGKNISDSHGSYSYASAKLKTSNLFSRKYGRFESRIKLPEGQGLWPAFWLLPQHDEYGSWAASGEIDIMENAGSRKDIISGALHYGAPWPENTYTHKEYKFAEGSGITDFHTYAIEWEPEEIRWYVDGSLYQTVDSWYSKPGGTEAKAPFPAPFDKEFYIILNLAVGGWFDGPPQDESIFPAEMIVDYVRVYE